MAPAWRMRRARGSGSATSSSRCSGARRSMSGRAASSEGTRISAPSRSQLARAIPARPSVRSWRSTSAATRSARPLSSVTKNRLGALVVLGLGEEVGGDPGRIGAGVGNDENLRGAGDHVDPDATEYLALGLGDVGVAGADDLVDRGDGGRAVGQRRDRLRPAHPIDLVDAGDVGGRQDERIDVAIRRRRHHRHAPAAGHLGRDRVHQNGAGIGGGAARHVEADRIDRPPAEAEADALIVPIVEIGRELALVEGADPAGGQLERRQLGTAAGGKGGGDRLLADPELPGLEVEAVEARRQPDEGRVALGPYLVEDGAHGVPHVGRLLAPALDERLEGSGEARVPLVKPARHTTPSSRAAAWRSDRRASRGRAPARRNRPSGRRWRWCGAGSGPPPRRPGRHE